MKTSRKVLTVLITALILSAFGTSVTFADPVFVQKSVFDGIRSRPKNKKGKKVIAAPAYGRDSMLATLNLVDVHWDTGFSLKIYGEYGEGFAAAWKTVEPLENTSRVIRDGLFLEIRYTNQYNQVVKSRLLPIKVQNQSIPRNGDTFCVEILPWGMESPDTAYSFSAFDGSRQNTTFYKATYAVPDIMQGTVSVRLAVKQRTRWKIQKPKASGGGYWLLKAGKKGKDVDTMYYTPWCSIL